MTRIHNNKINVFTRQQMDITTYAFLICNCTLLNICSIKEQAVDDSASKIAIRAQIWKFKASKSELEKRYLPRGLYTFTGSNRGYKWIFMLNFGLNTYASQFCNFRSFTLLKYAKKCKNYKVLLALIEKQQLV